MKHGMRVVFSKTAGTLLAGAGRGRVGTTLYVLAWLIGVWNLVVVIGLFIPALPWGSVVTNYAGTNVAAWAVTLAIGGIVVAALRVRRGKRLGGIALLTVWALVLVATVGATSALAVTAGRAGTGFTPFASFDPVWVIGGHPSKTITYTHDESTALKLDYYAPRNIQAGTTAPVILYVRGGGWNSQDRSLEGKNLDWFADHGYAVLSIDYTLATARRPTWDIAPKQVVCAMAWAKSHADEYRFDAGRLFMFGDSAGGNLAINAGYDAASGRAHSSSCGAVPKPVAATVTATSPRVFADGSYGAEIIRTYIGGTPEQYPSRARAIASDTHITPDAPPTFIVRAANDHTVPKQGSAEFIRKARAAGVAVGSIELPFSDHLLFLWRGSPSNQVMRNALLAFFDAHTHSRRS